MTPRPGTHEEQRRALGVACQRAELTMEQLWMGYFTLGGTTGMVEVEAFLHGLMDLPAGQRDILAHAVNEGLGELATSLSVPYSRDVRSLSRPRGPLASLARLLDGVVQVPPERLVAEVGAAARSLGVEVTIHLVDYGQEVLVPLHPDPEDPRGFTPGRPLSVEETQAGRAFQRAQVVAGRSGDATTLWIPLLDGVERLGVLDVRLPPDVDVDDAELRHGCRWLASLLGHLVTGLTARGDGLDAVRQLRPRSAAAELLWSLLPPQSSGTERFVVAGQIEPSHSTGGDAFDYALSETHAALAVFGSTGHSLPSGLVTAAALATYRSVRRNGGRIWDQARALDAVVAEELADRGPSLSAVLADLDLTTGRLEYVVAGHPAPLLVRTGTPVRTLAEGRRGHVGLGLPAVAVGEEMLRAGDSLLLYTEGVTGAQDEKGVVFGEQRLAALLKEAVSAGHPPAETVRRLTRAVMEHQHGWLEDDATLLLSTWLTAEPSIGHRDADLGADSY